MPEWVFHLLGYGGLCASVYAGIKADLARLHAKAESAGMSADKAHRRIDNLLERRV